MAGGIPARNKRITMKKVLSLSQAIRLAQKLRNRRQTLVIAGGCFDILHIGHIQFIEASKKKGDIFILLLESDATIKKLKGIHRPIHTQKERAYILSKLTDIDYIVPLPPLSTNEEYDKMISQLKPAIITTTKGDIYKHHKVRQAKLIGAKVLEVISRNRNVSTSKLFEALCKEL